MRGNAARAAPRDAGAGVRPREIYQNEITNALVNAVLDYTGALGVGARRVADGRGARERRRSAVRAAAIRTTPP